MPERHPDGSGADDADDRPLAGGAVHVRVLVVARVVFVTVAVLAGRRRVERHALGVEVAQRLLVVGVAALGRAADQVVGLVPGPHRGGPAAGRPCARYASTQRV